MKSGSRHILMKRIALPLTAMLSLTACSCSDATVAPEAAADDLTSGLVSGMTGLRANSACQPSARPASASANSVKMATVTTGVLALASRSRTH